MRVRLELTGSREAGTAHLANVLFSTTAGTRRHRHVLCKRSMRLLLRIPLMLPMVLRHRRRARFVRIPITFCGLVWCMSHIRHLVARWTTRAGDIRMEPLLLLLAFVRRRRSVATAHTTIAAYTDDADWAARICLNGCETGGRGGENGVCRSRRCHGCGCEGSRRCRLMRRRVCVGVGAVAAAGTAAAGGRLMLVLMLTGRRRAAILVTLAVLVRVRVGCILKRRPRRSECRSRSSRSRGLSRIVPRAIRNLSQTGTLRSELRVTRGRSRAGTRTCEKGGKQGPNTRQRRMHCPSSCGLFI